MSSYVSSRYYIEHMHLINIENQCRKELDNAKARISANLQAMRQELCAMKERERQRAAAEQRLKDTAAEELITEAARKKYDAQRAEQMLAEASRQLSEYEQKFGVNRNFQEWLQTQSNSFEMFGATEQLFQSLELFMESDLPAERSRLVKEREQIRITERVEQITWEHTHVKDQSAEFVSLRQEDEEGGRLGKSPWEQFLSRLSALARIQEEFQETGAAEMLEEGKQQPAARRNLFLLQNMDRLKEMEEESADLRRTVDLQQQSASHIYEEYLGVCLLCRESPTLTESASYGELERECRRLKEQYQKLREQQYISNAFSEVFEEYGISFESMHSDAFGGFQLEYHLDDQTGISVTRSGSGAFEMQFSGNSSSSEASLDEKRQVVEKAHSFCKHLPRIFEALKERGVLFDQVMLKEPDEETIRMDRRESVFRRREAGKLHTMTM